MYPTSVPLSSKMCQIGYASTEEPLPEREGLGWVG